MRVSARAPQAAERGVGLDVTQVLQTVAPARVVLDAVTMQLLKQSDQVLIHSCPFKSGWLRRPNPGRLHGGGGGVGRRSWCG